MATPKKRPSVRNKKTARPMSRQDIARADAPNEQDASPAASQTPHAALFPEVPSVPNPPEARIPFAGDAAAFGVGGAAVRSGGAAMPSSVAASGGAAVPSTGAGSTGGGDASFAENGPADFFDLGDGRSASGGAPMRASASRGMRGSSQPAKAQSRRLRTRAEAKGRSQSEGQERPRSASGRASRSKDTGRGKNGAPGKGGAKRVVLGIVGVVAVVAVALGAFFVWNAFFRYDDAADIQGEWRTQDNTMTVVIDGSNIRMPDLEYSYEIDTGAKRLTFHFSDLTGSGTYSFSSDRSTLTIVEGEGDTATTTVLVKVSNDTQATPQLVDQTQSEGATADGESASGDEGASGSDADADAENGEGAGDGSSDASSGGEESGDGEQA